jgi:Ser/Thr protein kinase RdoA (MazF antagonist)
VGSPSELLVPPDPVATAEAYDLGEPRGAPTVAARGELGRIWRLETTTGTWAVKELLRFDPAGVESAARRDVAFQQAAVQAAIPMPRPVVSKTGDVTTIVAATDGRSKRVRVYTWLDLASRDAVPDRSDVAAILGRLHALGLADDRPVDPWFAVPPPPERWPQLLHEASSQRAPWRPALADLVPIVAATLDAVPAVEMRSAITCHLDYNPENVLVDTQGRTVVVDW